MQARIIQIQPYMAATALITHQVEEPENEYRKAEQPDQLNYIQLINRFWQMHEEHCFTGNEIALYFYLLKSCNALGWKQSFKHANGYISGALAISEKTLINCRNKLKQAGLIEFSSGSGRRAMSDYSINTGNFTGFRGAFRADLGVHFGQVSGEKSSANTKLKLNKTKSKANALPAPPDAFVNWLKENCPTVATLQKQLVMAEYESLIADYGKQALVEILTEMENWKPLTTKCKSVNLTARKWLSRRKDEKMPTQEPITRKMVM